MPGRWRSKPPYGTPLDRAHPWAYRLLSFWPCNEAAGPKVYDLLGNTPLSTTGYSAGQDPWQPGPSGMGLQTPAGMNACAQGTLPTRLQIGYPHTLAFAGRIGGAASNGAKLLGVLPNNTNASPFAVAQIYVANQTSLWYGFANAASLVTAAMGTIPGPAGSDFAVVLRLQVNKQDAWINGVKVVNASATAAHPTSWTASSCCTLAGFTPAALVANCRPAYYGAWWAWAMPDGIASAISASPRAMWDLFAPASEAQAGYLRRTVAPDYLADESDAGRPHSLCAV